MTWQPLRERLPAIDPARAALQSRLVSTLDGYATAGLRLGATLGNAPRAVVALASDAGCFELSPRLAADTVPNLVADDGEPDAVATIAALAALEPLVAAVEHGLRTALRPTGVGAATLPLWLDIEARDETGTVRHAAMLGVADDLKLASPSRAARPSARLWRTPFQFTADGPRLTPARVGALACGDVVLLGGAALPGRFEWGGSARAASFRPADAAIVIAEPRGTSTVSEPEAPLDPDLRLPLTVEIGGGSATLGDLSDLVPGSVVPLGIVGATLPVTLGVGGSPVAYGELVAVGDAYGVLITRRVAD